MSIQFVAASSAAQTTSTVDVVLPKPVGVFPGHVIVAGIQTDQDFTVTLPAGWTSLQIQNTTDGGSLHTSYRVVAASDPSSYTFTLSSASSRATATAVAFSGVDTTSPIRTSATNGWGSGVITRTSPTLTGVQATDMVVIIGGGANQTADPAYDVNGPTTGGWTSPAAAHSGRGVSAFDFYNACDTSYQLNGTTGDFDYNSTSTAIVISVALKPDLTIVEGAPFWVSAGSYASGTGDVSPGLPPGWLPQDVFLMSVEFDSTDNPGISVSGWTQIGTTQRVTSGVGTKTGQAIFYRRASSTESAPTIIDTGDHTSAIIHAFRGCTQQGSPVNIYGENWTGTESTTAFPVSVTTTVDNCLVVLAVTHGFDTASAQFSGWTNANLSGLTERSDDSTSSGTGGGIGIATGTKITAGATSTSSVTLANASAKTYFTVALAPLTATEALSVRDDFNRADSTTLGTSSSGHTWVNGATTNIGVSDNEAYKSTGSSGDAVWYLGTAIDFSNVRTELIITAIEDQAGGVNTDGVAIRFRRADENNWWEWGMDPLSGYYALRKNVDGVLTIVNVSGTEWDAGDIIRVEAYEERVNCFVNQRMVVSVADTDLQENINVGIRMSVGCTDARADDFYALQLQEDIRENVGYFADYQVLVDWDNDDGLYLGDFENESSVDSWIPFGTVAPTAELSETYVHSGHSAMKITWNTWNLFQFDVAGHGFSQGQFAGDEYSNPPVPFKFDQAAQGFDDGAFAAFKSDVSPTEIDDSFLAPGVSKTITKLIPGRDYTLTCSVYVPTGSTVVNFGISGIDTPVSNTVFDRWEELNFAYTATATEHTAIFYSATKNPEALDECYVDEVMNIGEFEDVTCYVLNQSSPLIFSTGRDEARSLASFSPSELEMDCDNTSQIFSPDNSGSPLFGYLEPGKKVKVRSTYNNRVTGLFHGFVDNYILHPDHEDRYVTFTCIDGLQFLANAVVSTKLYPSVQTGEAINIVLDSVNWPADKREVEHGATTIKWWSEEDTDGLSAIQSIVQAEGVPAQAFVDNFGNFVFNSRHHRLIHKHCVNIQTTIKCDPDFDEPIFSSPMTYDIGWKDIINQLDVEVENRFLKELGEVWSSDDLVVLAAGETKNIKVKASNPFYNAVTPTSGYENITDFDADIGKDIVLKTGSGTLASITLTRTSGSSTEIQLTAGGSAVTIKKMILRAFSLDTDDSLKLFRENSTSVTKYGIKNSETSFPWAGLNDMEAIAEIILGTRAERLPVIHFTLNNGHPVRLSHIMDMELHERVHLVEMLQTFQNDDFYVETIEHKISNNGRSHTTIFGCEKARDQKVTLPDESADVTFTFDVAGKGFNDGYFQSGGEGLSLSENLFILDESRLDEDGLGY